MQRYAIYDLDRTLTRLPTWSRFLLFAMIRRQRWRLLLLPGIAGAALLRTIGLIDRTRLKEIMHRLALGSSADQAELSRLSSRFAAQEIATNVSDAAMARLAADRAEGRRIVVATAAHTFYALPIAQALGIADVVATQALIDGDGRITARIAGQNVYGGAKLDAVAAWLAAIEADRAAIHVRFYSDHMTDLPTFEWADEPVAVNPSPALSDVARARGWAVERWR